MSISGKVLRFAALSTVFFVMVATASPSDQPGDPVKMEEVVVVASPITSGNQVNRYGGQLSVVTQEQISDLNAQDLPSAVRRVPGVIISRQNPVGSFGGSDGGAIYIRGMGSSRPGGEIQTAVDGIPKTVGVWTHPLMDIMAIDPADRIEVYKGAQPVLFGNGSYGAVNVVTKRLTEEGYYTCLGGAYGSHNTFIESIEHGGKIKKTDYYLIQSLRKSSGHRDFAGGELQDYFVRLGHQVSEPWYLNLTVNQTDNFAEDPGPEGRPQERQGTYRSDDTMTVLTLAHQYPPSRGTLKLYWNRGTGDWQNVFDTTNLFYYDIVTDWDNYGARLQEILTPWKGGEILAGIDLDYIGGMVTYDRNAPRTDSMFPRETFRILSPYGTLSHLFGDKSGWHAIPSAGVRYFSHSDFDAEWGPQAGLILGRGNMEFHASCARGVNYPGVYVVTQSSVFWGGNTRWKDLDAETVDHIEAGISYTAGKKFRADLTFFVDDGKNRMLLINTPPPPRYENIGDFRTEGIEWTATLTPIEELSIFAGLTHLFKREPEHLPYAPYWSASAGLNGRFPRAFKISLDAQYVDNQFAANNRSVDFGGSGIAAIDSYFIVNGKLAWEFVLHKQGLRGEIYLAGENLTDAHYAFKKDYPMPGISGLLGLKLKF